MATPSNGDEVREDPLLPPPWLLRKQAQENGIVPPLAPFFSRFRPILALAIAGEPRHWNMQRYHEARKWAGIDQRIGRCVNRYDIGSRTS